MAESALIVGVGPGLSASIARRCAREGIDVTLASRRSESFQPLVTEIGATGIECDVVDPVAVDRLFEQTIETHGVPDWVVYNPSGRARGPIIELDPDAVRDALLVTAYGGFLVGQAAARVMLPANSGAIFFTGASASVKGFPASSSFAMGKFGLRGLAQSMARELSPQGIHVAHVIVDGGISRLDGARGRAPRDDDSWLDPDAIAETYWHLYRQHRSSWTWEIEVRPWLEKF